MYHCFDCESLLYDGFQYSCNCSSCKYWTPMFRYYYPEDIDSLDSRFSDDLYDGFCDFPENDLI